MVSTKEKADSRQRKAEVRESHEAIIEFTHKRIYEKKSSESCDFLLLRETHDPRYFGELLSGRGTRKCIKPRIKIPDQIDY